MMLCLAVVQGWRIQSVVRWAVVARLRATEGAVDERVEAGLSVRTRVEETRQRTKGYSEDRELTFGVRVPCSDLYVADGAVVVAVPVTSLTLLTHRPKGPQESYESHRHPFVPGYATAWRATELNAVESSKRHVLAGLLQDLNNTGLREKS